MVDRKPTIPEVRPLVEAIYKRNPAGCCLHIVLDDGNLEDDHVRFCVDFAKQQGHRECFELAKKLLLMSKTQRKQLSMFG